MKNVLYLQSKCQTKCITKLNLVKMKKNLVFGISMLFVGMVFVSCSSNEVYDETKAGEILYLQKKTAYNNAFVQNFGTIAKNHSWGFGEDAALTRGAATENYNNYELPDEYKIKGGPHSFVHTFNPATTTVDMITYENYFLQHYYKQTNNGNGNSHGNQADTHHNLSQLQAYNFNTGQWENVVNFVGGQNTHHMTDSDNKKMTKGVTLMVNMGTPTAGQPMFRWVSDDGYICENYIIKKINGEYYLGLGYNNENKTDYDAWIIKIIKAEGVPDYKERGRIMCEDLGSIGDFDFNDVVFDATIYNDGSINIVIWAAGGTLPISVAEVPVTLGEMTNTGVNENDEPQIINISAIKAAQKGWKTLKSIPVEVTSKGHTYELTAEYGEAPGKICTYIGLPWADEYIDIKDAYPTFTTWVREDHPENWFETHLDEIRTQILTDLILSNND